MLPSYHPYMYRRIAKEILTQCSLVITPTCYRRIAKEILSRGTEAQQGGGGAEPGAPPLPNLRAMLHKVVLCMRQGGDEGHGESERLPTPTPTPTPTPHPYPTPTPHPNPPPYPPPTPTPTPTPNQASSSVCCGSPISRPRRRWRPSAVPRMPPSVSPWPCYATCARCLRAAPFYEANPSPNPVPNPIPDPNPNPNSPRCPRTAPFTRRAWRARRRAARGSTW